MNSNRIKEKERVGLKVCILPLATIFADIVYKGRTMSANIVHKGGIGCFGWTAFSNLYLTSQAKLD